MKTKIKTYRSNDGKELVATIENEVATRKVELTFNNKEDLLVVKYEHPPFRVAKFVIPYFPGCVDENICDIITDVIRECTSGEYGRDILELLFTKVGVIKNCP